MKNTKIKWWVRFLLLFCRTHVAYDCDSEDLNCFIYYKKLGDTTYVIRERFLEGVKK